MIFPKRGYMLISKKKQKAVQHGFPPSEFESRLARSQHIMFRHELDALVLTAPSNFRYFTGFDSQFWESPTRPWFVIIPLSQEPIAVVPEIGAEALEKTWLSNIFSWPAPRPEDDGISSLANVIRNLPHRFSRIGMELGREQSLRMPVIEMRALALELNGNEIVNGADALWEIRMIKTVEEVSRIKHICRVVSEAYALVPKLVQAGDTEREAQRKLAIEILRGGADSIPFLPAISGPGGVPQIVCGPSDREISNGDILFFDTGSTFDGYFCDFDRNYAVGSVSDEARRAHELVWKATDVGIKAAFPGVAVHELHRKMAAVLENGRNTKNNVGRFGHGLGLQLTEPPSNMPGDETIIAPNMVLTIEPSLEYAPGKMIVHEEDLLITPDGPELLTYRAPIELPIIE